MNPCPCGYYQDTVKECTCSNQVITRYQKRISGPMLDRIDIHIEVPRVDYEKLSDDRLGEPSAAIRGRVEAARERQRVRFSESSGSIACNADMRPAQIRQYCQLDETSNALMRCKPWFTIVMNQGPVMLLRRFQRGLITGCLRRFHAVKLPAGSAPSRIWRGKRKSPPRIWRRRCNTDRSWE
jgi:predicted ATPase with chaperone activity